MQRISFRNKSSRPIEIIVEPAAANYELLVGQTVLFESSQSKTLEIEFDDVTLVVYEEFGSKIEFGQTLKMYIDGKLIYP